MKYNQILDFLKESKNQGNLEKVLDINYLMNKFNINFDTTSKIINDYQNLEKMKLKRDKTYHEKIYQFLEEEKLKNNLEQVLKTTFLKEKFDLNLNSCRNIIRNFCQKNNLEFHNFVRNNRLDYEEIFQFLDKYKKNNYLNQKEIDKEFLMQKFCIKKSTIPAIIRKYCAERNVNSKRKIINYEKIYQFLDEAKSNGNLEKVLNSNFLQKEFKLTNTSINKIMNIYCSKNNLDKKDFLQKNKIDYEKMFEYINQEAKKSDLKEILQSQKLAKIFLIHNNSAKRIITNYCKKYNLKRNDFIGNYKIIEYDKVLKILEDEISQNSLEQVLNVKFIREKFNCKGAPAIRILKKYCLKHNINAKNYLIVKKDYLMNKKQVFEFLNQHKDDLKSVLKSKVIKEKFNISLFISRKIIINYCKENNLNQKDFIKYTKKTLEI